MTPVLPRRVVAGRSRGREDGRGRRSPQGWVSLAPDGFGRALNIDLWLRLSLKMLASHGLIRSHSVISLPSVYLDCTGWQQIVREILGRLAWRVGGLGGNCSKLTKTRMQNDTYLNCLFAKFEQNTRYV